MTWDLLDGCLRGSTLDFVAGGSRPSGVRHHLVVQTVIVAPAGKGGQVVLGLRERIADFLVGLHMRSQRGH